MDVYALTKKQRPTHLTRGEPNKTDSAMAPAEQPSQLPQLQRQQQQQQQQQSADLGAPPTLQDIEIRYSQLPPQYRQAVLEQQLLQYQQSQQRGATAAAAVTKSDTPRLPSFPSTSPSKESTYSNNNTTPHQRIASAPASSFRSDRSSATPSHTTSGPSRAHWKPDSSTLVCKWPGCPREFGFFDRRHHCRKCGDIFCSAHCSKAIPLDYGLEFNPAMGVMSRACPACFEAYEQWRGLGTTTTTTTTRSTMKAGALGSISDSSATTNSGVGKDGLLSSHNTRKSEGRLGQTGNSSSETLGREDIVRLPKSVSDTIAIKTRPVEDTTMMPMPSVPHDWSWSTF